MDSRAVLGRPLTVCAVCARRGLGGEDGGERLVKSPSGQGSGYAEFSSTQLPGGLEALLI